MLYVERWKFMGTWFFHYQVPTYFGTGPGTSSFILHPHFSLLPPGRPGSEAVEGLNRSQKL